jgi:hypothetical protein
VLQLPRDPLPASELLDHIEDKRRLAGPIDVKKAGERFQSRVHDCAPDLRIEHAVAIIERGVDGVRRTPMLSYVELDLLWKLIARAAAIASPRRVVLDMNSTEVRVHGRQEQSAYNGHFESSCYHPLLLFNREGDCLAAKLRPGNVHSADGWEELLLPEIDRQQAQGKQVTFRGDAAFAKPELYEALEEREVKYAIRLPANHNLQRNLTELLTSAGGRSSSNRWSGSRAFSTRGQPVGRCHGGWWRRSSFTVGNCSPRVGFIVTNLAGTSRAVVRFYSKRGTA